MNTNYQSKGATYVTMLLVLFVLLVSSVLGMNAVQNSSLQFKIANNVQQKQISFQYSAASAGIGESLWSAAVLSCFDDLTSCSIDFDPQYLGEDFDSSAFWSSANVGESDGIKFGHNTVEYFGERPIPGDNLRAMHFYRVTGRGDNKTLDSGGNRDSDATSETIIQTMVLICAKKDGGLC